jgi:hypothetical protein
MKRIILTAVIILAVSFASFARKFLAEGKTNSAFGNYKIEIDDKFITLDGKQHKPFVISYENSDKEVRVAIDMDRKGKKYYVLSENLSVQYVCNRKYFGVEKLNQELEKDGYKTSETALNKSEYFHQKVIKSGKGSALDNTKLIATFYPMLINNTENVLATK